MMNSSLLLTGIGLRPSHYADFLEKRPGVAWIEVHSENYFGEGGRPIKVLETLRNEYPVSLHGVSTSLGSTDELNWFHLKKVRDLILKVDPCLISDHLAWVSFQGQYFHDLLPLPYTEEALLHVSDRISQVQEYLGKQILIENIASYVGFQHSTISEEEFLRELALKSGCGILLDINNIYVSATNLNFDPINYITSLPPHLIQEIHLGGFTSVTIEDKEVLLDTHNKPVMPAVWEIYRQAICHLGKKPTMIEWDKDLPSLDTLCFEAYRAEQVMRESYVATKRAI